MEIQYGQKNFSIAGDHGYFVKQTKDGGYIISGDGFINGVGGAYIIKPTV